MSSAQPRSRRPHAAPASAGAENLLLDIAEISLCGSRASSGRFTAALQPRPSGRAGHPRSPVGGGSTPKNDSTAQHRRFKANEATPGMFELDDADDDLPPAAAGGGDHAPAGDSFVTLPADDISSARWAGQPATGASWLDGGATSSVLSTHPRPSAGHSSASLSHHAASGATHVPLRPNWSHIRRSSAAPPQRDVVKKLSFSGGESVPSGPVVASIEDSPHTSNMTPGSTTGVVARSLSWEDADA
uniref:Uncharacterized protein n=1 Tax=Neobodo designis TaxID=312471 RepID=A0A7S1M5V7_NEODS|mmetsp:Transcript_34492/g.106539  ORF Transcript_34492/g.106539 Transcript_34492/m.106539 type:complete len:245 (+) Transcript_34492:137-871(+)